MSGRSHMEVKRLEQSGYVPLNVRKRCKVCIHAGVYDSSASTFKCSKHKITVNASGVCPSFERVEQDTTPETIEPVEEPPPVGYFGASSNLFLFSKNAPAIEPRTHLQRSLDALKQKVRIVE